MKTIMEIFLKFGILIISPFLLRMFIKKQIKLRNIRAQFGDIDTITDNDKGTQGIQGTESFSLDKDDKNLKVLANRKFQNQVLFNISRITWTFNENGSKVNVKATWFAVINIVNSTANVESLGEGKFVGKGFVSQKFSLEGNRIFLPDGTSLGEVF